jgi:hypothetical protein
VYLQSVLPRERHNAGWVRGLNARLEQIATRHGLHLSDAGDDLWYDLLRPHVLTSNR